MIAVFDDFIQDETLLNDIAAEGDDFFYPTGKYTYWKGWWAKPASNVKQRLTQYIWGTKFPLSNVNITADGFEYWTGIQSANPTLGHKDNLGFHFDKDESWFKKTNGEEIVRPVIGTVYYPPQPEFEGGELIVHTAGKDKAPDVIQTRPNRLIIFRAGDDVHAVDTVTKGTRKAIAINLWSDVPFAKTNGDLVVEQV